MGRLERAAYVAVILTCVLVVGNLARNYYLSYYKADLRPKLEIAKGTMVKLPGDSQSSPQPGAAILVLALSTQCSFCDASVPFYQRLTAFKNSAPPGLRLVVVMQEPRETAAAYLKEHDIGVDEVLSMPPSQIGAKGTPTLLLLDGQSKLMDSWVGRLDESGEAQVMASLKKFSL